MACEILLMLERFIASVALERFLPSVLVQITDRGTSIVALVTFERLFSGVLPHYVNFQFTSCNTRILASCASLWLFSRVHLLVPLQVACLCCFIFTLITMIHFFPGVLLDMRFEVGQLAA